MLEYMGDGCYVPKDVTSVRFKEGYFISVPSDNSNRVEIGADTFTNC